VSGVYVHIPFCKQACVYCNFYFKTGRKQAEELVQAILLELELSIHERPFELETLYFGGGTPSYLPPHLIETLIQAICKKFNLNPELLKEITLEANPDDMSEVNLNTWKSIGITRLSVGVQSFFENHLRWMNRAHSVQEAENSLRMAQDLGFDLSLDLIFGIPESSDLECLENIKKATAFKISHLSCYGLTLEDNTPWQSLIKRNKSIGPEEAKLASQFQLTMKTMKELGWQQYEISNYCLPGKTAIHNTSYWQNKPYIGLGPSAHSYDGFKRSWNVSDINSYIESIRKGELPTTFEELTKENKYNEYIMTALRTMWGMSIDKVNTFLIDNPNFKSILEKQLGNGNLVLENNQVILTDKGKMYADAIASEFFV
jgi:oxygen-independent coproporphyrinogen-3 oxidase